MLAKINMSEALKKELFGFDEEYYCTNSNDGISLIIENHPLKGKSIMTRERYEANQKMQRRIEGVKASSANEDCCPEEGNILDSQGSANGNSFSGGSMVEHSQRTF